MLSKLTVKNFALIDLVEVNFEPGLNIITGETGAGKSILIDALGSTLGEKVYGDILRKKDDRAIIEAIFNINENAGINSKVLEQDLHDFKDSVILRKEVHQTGRNRSFVNDSPVAADILSEFGDLLVDLHGQHEHQALLKMKYHIQYLDDYGGFDDMLKQVHNVYDKVTSLIEERESLKSKEQSLSEKKEIYEFQINEIAGVNPQLGEEEELIKEEKILRNSEKLYQLTNELYQQLYETEGSAIEIFSRASEKLSMLTDIDKQFEPHKQECQSARIIIEEISKFLQSYNSNIAFDPARLQEIRERLAHFSGLKKKYGGSIEDILKQKDNIEKELLLIENLDGKINEKTDEIESEKKVLAELCLNLSHERTRIASQLQKSVEEALAQLGMSRAKFEVLIDQREDPEGLLTIEGKKYRTGPRGIDHVEFLLSANPGEEPKPLVKVASGGEVSRIMLALKTALAEADKIPVLIFDEIDIGISGRIAQAVGKSLKKLAQTHQIICITHLPQIASMSDYHFVVEKYSNEGRTFTKIRKLTPEEKPLEIAKLLGGEQVTVTHIKSAEELIEQVKQI